MSSSLKQIISRWDTDTTTYQPTQAHSQLEAYINSVKPIDESVNLSATLEQTVVFPTPPFPEAIKKTLPITVPLSRIYNIY